MRNVFYRNSRDGKTTASKTDKHRAELRSERACSKWRTTLRDAKIIQNQDLSWSVVHYTGRILGTYADVTDATASL